MHVPVSPSQGRQEGFVQLVLNMIRDVFILFPLSISPIAGEIDCTILFILRTGCSMPVPLLSISDWSINSFYMKITKGLCLLNSVTGFPKLLELAFTFIHLVRTNGLKAAWKWHALKEIRLLTRGSFTYNVQSFGCLLSDGKNQQVSHTHTQHYWRTRTPWLHQLWPFLT